VAGDLTGPDGVSGRFDLVVRAPRAVTPDGERPVELGIDGGRIVEVVPLGTRLDGERLREYGNGVAVLPGLVDTHVHLQDPGHPEWEDFSSGTLAAAAGGVTTLVDMPLDCVPVTTSAAALSVKRAAAEGHCHVDVGFWGGAVPGNAAQLSGLHAAGVLGFKCFLGNGTADFPAVSAAELSEAMAVLAPLDAVLLVHAEHEPDAVLPAPQDYPAWLAARPASLELAAVRVVVRAAASTGCRAHVVHVSAAEIPVLLARARADGVRVTAETAPHYLVLSAEQIPAGAVGYVAAPPVRDQLNADALWDALRTGAVDMVVSDHSPAWTATDVERRPCAVGALGGIASLQFGLSLIWTQASQRGFALTDVVGWMCAAPARLAGLERKGAIAVGMDADLCVFDPDAESGIADLPLHQRQPPLPYLSRTVRGVVRETWLRGTLLTPATPAGGRLLTREAA
jgi:allantoinase